ncbi:DUF4349 domain-containing protein, partial [Micromonospora deserti]
MNGIGRSRWSALLTAAGLAAVLALAGCGASGGDEGTSSERAVNDSAVGAPAGGAE